MLLLQNHTQKARYQGKLSRDLFDHCSICLDLGLGVHLRPKKIWRIEYIEIEFRSLELSESDMKSTKSARSGQTTV